MLPFTFLVAICAFGSSAMAFNDHTTAQAASILNRLIDNGFMQRQLTSVVGDHDPVRLLGLDQTDAFRFAGNYAQQTVKAHLLQPDVVDHALPHLRAALHARDEPAADRAVLEAMLHGGAMLRKQMQSLSGYRLANDTSSDVWSKFRDDLNPIPDLEMKALLSRMLPTAVFVTRQRGGGQSAQMWCQIPNEIEFCVSEPLAVASIGSVHRVNVLGLPRRMVTIPVAGGKPIRVPIPSAPWGENALAALRKFHFVLKIRNPSLVAKFEEEAEVMREVIDPRPSMQAMYNISVKGIRDELDLAQEAEKMKAGKRVYETFLDGYTVRVPQVYGVTRDPLLPHKGGAMIFMEDAGEAAKSVSSGDADPHRGLLLIQLAVLQMVRLLDGTLLTNSDLHPGNILWDADRKRLWVLDFGNAGIPDAESLQVLRRIATTFFRIFVQESESLVREVVGDSEEAMTSERGTTVLSYLNTFAGPEHIFRHRDPIAYMATIASHLRAVGNGVVEYPPTFYPPFRSFLYAMQVMRAGLADLRGLPRLSARESERFVQKLYARCFQTSVMGLHRDISPFHDNAANHFFLEVYAKVLRTGVIVAAQGLAERETAYPPSISEWQAQQDKEELREMRQFALRQWQYMKRKEAAKKRRTNVIKTVSVGALLGGSAYSWYRNYLASKKAQAGMPEVVVPSGTVSNSTIVG